MTYILLSHVLAHVILHVLRYVQSTAYMDRMIKLALEQKQKNQGLIQKVNSSTSILRSVLIVVHVSLNVL